jgi:hypothetical protein
MILFRGVRYMKFMLQYLTVIVASPILYFAVICTFKGALLNACVGSLDGND